MVGAAGRAASLVGFLVLAGCLGGGSGEVLQTEAGAALEDIGGNETAVANLSFDGSAVDATLWANGSAGMTATCPMACWSNVTDISAVVPHGVPVLVTADFRPQDPQLVGVFGAQVFIYPGQDAYSYRSGYTVYGNERMVTERLFARGLDAVELEVYSTEPGVPEPGEYSLEIRVTADPSRLPAGAAAAFDADPDATYEFRPGGAASMDAAVYGPDDVPVARLNGTGPATIAVDVAGEYVLVSRDTSTNITVVSRNGTTGASLRPVGVTTVASEVRPVAGPTSWTFQASAAPIEVRVALISALPVQAEATQDHVVVESPAGAVLDEHVGCDTLCYGTGPWIFFLNTTLGDLALVPGEYTVTVTPGGAEAGLAAESYEWLDRSR